MSPIEKRDIVGPPQFGILHGKYLFMSASVPSIERQESYRRIPDAQVEIEDAVASLARAVFAQGGRLVFGGHPSISPLVAMIAGEYLEPQAPEPTGERRPAPVVIHQLDVFKPEVPDATQMMERLGQATIVWHRTEPSERQRPWDAAEIAYGRSLTAMRAEMLSDPAIAAMVCIGGMEGVEEEARLFLQMRAGAPLYLLARTGGATALLAEQLSRERNVRVIDDELLVELKPRLRVAHGEMSDAPLRYTPYPLIMQRIVREIADV